MSRSSLTSLVLCFFVGEGRTGSVALDTLRLGAIAADLDVDVASLLVGTTVALEKDVASRNVRIAKRMRLVLSIDPYGSKRVHKAQVLQVLRACKIEDASVDLSNMHKGSNR